MHVCVCTCVYICTDTLEGVLKIVSMVAYLRNSVHIYVYMYVLSLSIYISHRGEIPISLHCVYIYIFVKPTINYRKQMTPLCT